MLNEKEKSERAAVRESGSLRDDMRHLAENRHNPFLKEGTVDVDMYIEFMNTYNEFINHMPKPFKPMNDRIMKL
jgi:hypothetical protein